MKPKILIPVDFSKNSLNALDYATELYKNKVCEFFIVNAYYLSGYDADSLLIPKPDDKALNTIKENSQKNIAVVKSHVESQHKNWAHTFHFASVFGPLLQVLTDEVEKKDIELIIMGAKGEQNSQNLIYGSRTVSIMEKVRNCPVLVIPNQSEFTYPSEIVFPTRFTTHFKHAELKHLTEISKIAHAPIRLLYITDKDKLSTQQQVYKELLEEIFEGYEYSFHKLSGVDLETGLNCFMESRESGMIAFINKKHKFFDSIFSNPLVKDLGHAMKVPILAMHDQTV
ncbi:MAG: universal stress protein [Leeuwenhoekiella sp.]